MASQFQFIVIVTDKHLSWDYRLNAFMYGFLEANNFDKRKLSFKIHWTIFITGCLQSTHPFRRNIICVSLCKLFVAYIWRETCGKILVCRGDLFLKLWAKSLLPMTIKQNMIFHFYEFISDCWSLCLKSNINQRHEKCYVSGKTF